jgi:hypothetical protein
VFERIELPYALAFEIVLLFSACQETLFDLTAQAFHFLIPAFLEKNFAVEFLKTSKGRETFAFLLDIPRDESFWPQRSTSYL